MLEAENSYSSRCEARLADPDILRTIYLSILGIVSLQLLVQLVGLVHYVEVGNFPATEVE